MARSGIVASFVPRLRDYDGSGAACDAFGKPLHNRLGPAAIQVSVSLTMSGQIILLGFFEIASDHAKRRGGT
jgi:hypothetical protein